MRARHPRLIHASITGFGETGPYAERAAHDINYEALSGILRVTRPRTDAGDAPPEVPRSLIADIGAAMNGAAGILAALYARERTGEGAAVDVSIHESALAWLLFPAARDLVAGSDDGRARPADRRPARLLQHLPHGRRPLPRARRARAQVLEGVLRARRPPRLDRAPGHRRRRPGLAARPTSAISSDPARAPPGSRSSPTSTSA